MENESLAKTLIHDLKDTNKRQFIITIIILCMWFATIGGFIYYISTSGNEIITETADTGEGGNACVGDNCYNGDIDYGESD